MFANTGSKMTHFRDNFKTQKVECHWIWAGAEREKYDSKKKQEEINVLK